ncbi:MAG: chorismate synthase [Firmicutes bacterium]|nr:chorismate synthase [Bacillota bacterium]
MSGSVYGKNFTISTWGESHGKALGVVIDGCPAGIELCEEDIQKDLDLRKPGSNKFGTKRKESDTVHILSGVFEGKTTGTPISLVVYNEDHHSADYGNIAYTYRPGHADYTFDAKYGFRDYRGGGRSSGRETLCRVAAGAVAKKILSELGISFITYSKEIAGFSTDKIPSSKEEIFADPLYMADAEVSSLAQKRLTECIENCDSAGGIVECRIKGVMAGIGETVFDKLDSSLAKAIFSIGAVKGFEIGSGFEVALSKGSENNDNFFADENGIVSKKTNNAGGILGGMSDGDEIVFRAAFKPTPSIFKSQETVTKDGTNTTLEIHGRHDPIIVPRAVIVVEAMAAITLVDLIFSNMFARMDKIKDFYLG